MMPVASSFHVYKLPQLAPGIPPVFDIAALVAALREAPPPPPPPQSEMMQSLLAITHSLAAISQWLEAPAASEKRLRSPSPSPSRHSPPPLKRPFRREDSVSPARTRSGQSSPVSLPGQFSDQLEDKEEERHNEEEAFDPCGIPPVEASPRWTTSCWVLPRRPHRSWGCPCGVHTTADSLYFYRAGGVGICQTGSA